MPNETRSTADADGDGDLDLCVTGFGREYNIYYRQDSPGLWTDDTANQGLVQPTLMTVGFGTQAIDIDSDGIDELVVTNGNIGDFGGDTPPMAQPLQLFRRGAHGRFSEVDLAGSAEYFAKPHVGRALWKLDANGDFKEDFVITHQDEPPRLLVNRTNNANHQIAIRLVGTRVARDAVGAIVRFECGDRRRTLWALAGDGYFCSNHRIVCAGLGGAESVTNVTVTWPDGTVETIGRLRADVEYGIVQGQGEAFPVRVRSGDAARSITEQVDHGTSRSRNKLIIEQVNH